MKAANRILVSLVIASAILQGQSAVASPHDVTLVTGAWAPYTSSKTKGKGFFTEIVTAAFKRMGKTPHYVFLPWKRGQAFVRHGRAFATFPYIATDARRKHYYFSDIVVYSRGVFFYDKRDLKYPPVYQNLSQLKGYRVGGALGYWYVKPFRKAGLDLTLVVSDQQIMRLLAANRVDLVATDEMVGWHIINQHYPQRRSDFAILPRPLNQSGLRLMVSKQYGGAKALLKAFNRALEAIRRNGEYAAILRRHGLPAAGMPVIEKHQ